MGVVLVRWRTRGALIDGGEAYRRDAGDVDEMPEADAKTLLASGMIEVLKGDVPTVARVEEDEG